MFQCSLVYMIGHRFVTCVSQIIAQWGIFKGRVTCMQELFDVVIDKEFFNLFFCVNP
jgi:hypothetical protein